MFHGNYNYYCLIEDMLGYLKEAGKTLGITLTDLGHVTYQRQQVTSRKA